MLRVLSQGEIAQVSGGLYEDSDSFEDGGFTGDGGFDDGGDYGGGGGGDYGGGGEYGPGQVSGPPDTSNPPAYDPYSDPNGMKYGQDPNNPYENPPASSGSGAPVNSGSTAINSGPSYVGSDPHAPSATYGPSVDTGNGSSVRGGVYGPVTNPSGGSIQYQQQF